MNRYQDITVKTKRNGIQFYRDVKYPDIPIDPNDLWVITSFGDRYDLIAYDYYQDVTLYWIIVVANSGLPRDTLFVPAGTQLRIPNRTADIIQAYNDLNSQ